ncbi:RHS repeat-associated core domain-containing protein [Cruoricaptor ignavus]|uniref:RHS repeat-associated core domain-containing protein n=2 Tax=Cruoricaptor ignavus TaxID=1118202 RepID=A0A1M6HM29_9FLAO|nr:RHS repeat-associated core domain-containing protein [Cruoricaptor ignavus]
MRQMATYGGNFAADGEGRFTKYYSEDGSFEVTRNNQTGEEKHILYIGGSPYEANIVYLKNYKESSGSYKFLHKDYLGSILAISDEAGNKVEQRHYDAWGNLTHLQVNGGAILTDENQIRDFLSNGGLLLDRGYTSHEHFAEVGLIHMNGRLYDPLLRRFLNADENIQDMFNTQNYNKYGYVLNNPLMFNDPSGEFIFAIFAALPLFWGTVATAAVIGAAIGVGMYMIQAAITGNWSWGGLAKSFFVGALTGAVSGALGQVFTAGGFWATVGNGALAGAGSGGITSVINGQNFFEGIIKGAVIGGAIGAVSYGLGKLFNDTNGNQPVSEVKREDVLTSTSSGSGDAQKYSYGTMKEFEKGYGGLGNHGVEHYYLKTPNGYAVAQDNSFYKMNFWDKIGVNGQRATGDVLGVTVGKNIYLPKAAFASKSLLTEVVTHETGHVILNSSSLSSLANTATSNMGKYSRILDNYGHISIRKMTIELFNKNRWLTPNWYIPAQYFYGAKPSLDKLLLPLIKSFKF